MSQLWWERWFADREERIKAQPSKPGQSARRQQALPINETQARQRYILDPDGTLRPVVFSA